MKTALITGVDGQDGSYLADMLVPGSGYEVIGVARPGANKGFERISNEVMDSPNFTFVLADLLDYSTVERLMRRYEPDEVYHLAALSHVGDSFKHPELTFQTNTATTIRFLETIKSLYPNTKFYFAGSSETLVDACTAQRPLGSHGPGGEGNEECYTDFANCKHVPQASHRDPWTAHSPYAASKVSAQQLVKIYREAYGLFAVNGIAFNHESPRRGKNFVTAKIVDGLKKRKIGGEKIVLGSNTFRDWHHARDTVRGMFLALQQGQPQDYTFASGRATSVREFAKRTCDQLGLDLDDSVSFENKSEKRPWDVHYLRGDTKETRERLGWAPTYNLDGLIRDMIEGRNG